MTPSIRFLVPCLLALASPLRSQERVAVERSAPTAVQPAPSVAAISALSPLSASLAPASALPMPSAGLQPAALPPAAAQLGLESPSALPGAAAGSAETPPDGAGAARAGELFDGGRDRLHQDDVISLILSGYRFDSAGHLREPDGGTALTNAQVDGLRNVFRESRNRRALLRVDREQEQGSDTKRKDALMSLNRDALPREVLKAGKTSPEKERAVTLRRLASLYRRWLEKPPPSAPDSLKPAGAEFEEKLGALVSGAIVERLKNDAEGARLLAELKDERGRPVLPTMRVLRLDERYGALYTSYGRQIIVSLDYLRRHLLARLPEGERAEAGRRLADEASAAAWLSEKPARAALAAESLDVTLFHELVHFKQDLQRPYMSAMNRGEVPLLMTVEHEYEAYFRQNLYIHSLLSRPGAAANVDRVDDYLRLIDDFESWRAHIDDAYGTRFLNIYTNAEDLASLQDGSRRLAERLAGPSSKRSETASAKVEGFARGSSAVDEEKKSAAALLADYRARWPGLALEGLKNWVRLSAEAGRLPQIVLAYRRLAKLSPPDEAARLEREADATSDKALIRLAKGEDPLHQRIEWINSLIQDFNSRRAPWKKELWTSIFRDYPEMARRLREEAAASPDEAARKDVLQRAEGFEKYVGSSRAILRGHAETNLAAARAEKDPKRLAVLLEWGSMQAGVLDDEDMIAAFVELLGKLQAARLRQRT